MKHLSEDDLIALYYGETATDSDARLHLGLCRECAAAYAELKQDLEGVRSAPLPQRSAEYGEQVWQALQPALTSYDRPARHGWRIRMQWRTAGFATLCAVLIALAFVGGRFWERHAAKTKMVAGNASPQAAQRVVLVVLTDHLDRTERLLVALEHADPGDTAGNSELQSQARELLASNRLYRTSASEAGDPALAGALDRLERVLAEVANDPSLNTADLDRVRKEMNAEGILFEIRVLLSRPPDRGMAAEYAKGASI
jgi:hypothetical protein